MRREIRMAGFGGQGVITMGTVLAVAVGIFEDRELAQTQSYGPEARGGACRSDVVISDEPIDYTRPVDLDFFIAMSGSALKKYWSDVRKGRTRVLVDQTLITNLPEHSPPVLGLEATRIAEEELKDRLMANMILLGAMAALTRWVRLEALGQAAEKVFSPRSLSLARAALQRGFTEGERIGKGMKARRNSPEAGTAYKSNVRRTE